MNSTCLQNFKKYTKIYKFGVNFYRCLNQGWTASLCADLISQCLDDDDDIPSLAHRCEKRWSQE